MEKLEYLEENSLEQIRELAEHLRARVGNGTPGKQILLALKLQTIWKNWIAYQEEIFFFPLFCFLMFFGSSDYLEQDNEIERIIIVIQEVINLIQAINILGWLERKSYFSFPAIFLLYMDISNHIMTSLALSCKHIIWRIRKDGIYVLD